MARDFINDMLNSEEIKKWIEEFDSPLKTEERIKNIEKLNKQRDDLENEIFMLDTGNKEKLVSFKQKKKIKLSTLLKQEIELGNLLDQLKKLKEERNKWIEEFDSPLKTEERRKNIEKLSNQIKDLENEIFMLDTGNKEKLISFKQKKKIKLSTLLKQEIELVNLLDQLKKIEEKIKTLNNSDNSTKIEHNLKKLIIKQFYDWNKQDYKETDQKIIDFNYFKKFQKEFLKQLEEFINNFNEKKAIDKLTKRKLEILINSIETFIMDVTRDSKFKEKENVNLINMPNELKHLILFKEEYKKIKSLLEELQLEPNKSDTSTSQLIHEQNEQEEIKVKDVEETFKQIPVEEAEEAMQQG